MELPVGVIIRDLMTAAVLSVSDLRVIHSNTALLGESEIFSCRRVVDVEGENLFLREIELILVRMADVQPILTSFSSARVRVDFR